MELRTPLSCAGSSMSSMKLTMQVSRFTDFLLLSEVIFGVVDGVDRLPAWLGAGEEFALGAFNLMAEPDGRGVSGLGAVGVKLLVSLSDQACAKTSLPVQHVLAAAINRQIRFLRIFIKSLVRLKDPAFIV